MSQPTDYPTTSAISRGAGPHGTPCNGRQFITEGPFVVQAPGSWPGYLLTGHTLGGRDRGETMRASQQPGLQTRSRKWVPSQAWPEHMMHHRTQKADGNTRPCQRNHIAGDGLQITLAWAKRISQSPLRLARSAQNNNGRRLEIPFSCQRSYPHALVRPLATRHDLKSVVILNPDGGRTGDETPAHVLDPRTIQQELARWNDINTK